MHDVRARDYSLSKEEAWQHRPTYKYIADTRLVSWPMRYTRYPGAQGPWERGKDKDARPVLPAISIIGDRYRGSVDGSGKRNSMQLLHGGMKGTGCIAARGRTGVVN